MGMESFCIDILFEQVADMEHAVYRLNSQFDIEQYFYSKKFFRRRKIKADNVYIFQKYIIMHQFYDYIYILLEGCLADFENNIRLMYNIVEMLQHYHCSVKIGTEIYNNQLTFSEFKVLITKFYKNKYDDFVLKYGNIKIKVLPGADFYDLKNLRKLQ